MRLTKRDFIKVIGASALVPGMSHSQEADYPNRPVTMIVPFPPGGATDATMRVIAEHFRKATGQTMTIENKPGGGTLVAMNYLKPQKPDGYTLACMTRAQFASYWVVGGKNAAHPFDDFTFISATHGSIFALVTRADSPYKSLADVVAAAKANPGKISVGNIGAGTTHNLVALEFARLAKIELIHASFKGEGDSNNAVLGGHLDLSVSSGGVIPLIDSGKLRVLAVALDQRLAKYPTWPTFTEQGYPMKMDTTVGVGGPKGMDPAIVAKLDGIFRTMTQSPEFAASLERLYQPVKYLNSEAFTNELRQRVDTEKALVEQYNLRQP